MKMIYYLSISNAKFLSFSESLLIQNTPNKNTVYFHSHPHSGAKRFF